MTMPLFYRDTVAHARANPLWGAAFFFTLLIPFMVIFARVGFEICGGLIGLMFVWHSARARQWAWLRDPFSIACLVMWAWMLLVVQPLAISPSAQWTEAVAWIRFPLMFTALRFWVLAVPAARTTLAMILAVLLSLVVVDTLWQFLQGVSFAGHPRTSTGRLTGPFENPKVGIFLGKFALVALPLCVAAALAEKSRWWLAVSLALWTLVIVTVLLSGERSAFLMIMMATGVIALLMLLRDKRLCIPYVAVAFVAVLGFSALYHTSSWVKLRVNEGYDTITNYSQSDYGALAMSAYSIGLQHPLHGVGVFGYRGVAQDLDYKGVMFRGLHPHNMFLEIFAESGLPGLLILVGMIGTLARNAVQQFRRTQGMQALFPATAIAVLVQHFFPLVGMHSFFSNWSAVIIWFCLAVIFSAISTKGRVS